MDAVLRLYEPADLEKLVAMYAAFEPKGAFQGLPPVTVPQVRAWLADHLGAGNVHFVIALGGRIAGHAMLSSGPEQNEAEVAIFLHQDFRGRGLGRKLLLGALQHGCKQMHLDRVWLSVQGSNPAALHLFESVGFRQSRPADFPQWELDMARPSNCAKCKGQRCAVFAMPLPQRVALKRRLPAA